MLIPKIGDQIGDQMQPAVQDENRAKPLKPRLSLCSLSLRDPDKDEVLGSDSAIRLRGLSLLSRVRTVSRFK